tara:strand:+ start:150 stop:485 length:336 start_codon:yes stop_codon:yes gene_type:complete
MRSYTLRNSNRKGKKFMMIMPDENHTHHFGATGYRDYTLMNNSASKFYEPDEAERKRVRKRYRDRHRGDKGLGSRHSPAELAWSLLWTKPTLAESIKYYENKFGVNVINKT